MTRVRLLTPPAFTAPDIDAPYLAPQHVRPSATRVWDGFVAWMLISSMTILVFSFIGVQEFGVLRTVNTAARVPIAMALATLAHADQQGSGLGYIDHIEWAKFGDLSSLRVYPTAAGREASIGLVSPDARRHRAEGQRYLQMRCRPRPDDVAAGMPTR